MQFSQANLTPDRSMADACGPAPAISGNNPADQFVYALPYGSAVSNHRVASITQPVGRYLKLPYGVHIIVAAECPTNLLPSYVANPMRPDWGVGWEKDGKLGSGGG